MTISQKQQNSMIMIRKAGGPSRPSRQLPKNCLLLKEIIFNNRTIQINNEGWDRNNMNAYLFRRLKTQMIFMKPILTYATLNHLHLFFSRWIRIRATTCAIGTFKILAVWILEVFWVFISKELTKELPKFWISTITPEFSLGPQFHNLKRVAKQNTL